MEQQDSTTRERSATPSRKHRDRSATPSKRHKSKSREGSPSRRHKSKSREGSPKKSVRSRTGTPTQEEKSGATLQPESAARRSSKTSEAMEVDQAGKCFLGRKGFKGTFCGYLF